MPNIYDNITDDTRLGLALRDSLTDFDTVDVATGYIDLRGWSSLADILGWKMIIATHMDGKPLALGGLGPQWAVYEADSIPAFKSKPVNERFAACPWGLYYIDVAI